MIKFRLGFLLSLLPALPASAISLTSGGYTTDFSAKPGTGDFSTRTVAGGSGDITTASQLDTRVQTLSSDSVNEALADAAGPPAAGASGQYSAELDLILTMPTGVRASVLMATITNDTGATLTDLTASYDLGRIGATGSEQVDGQRVYWSVTGSLNGWTAAGDFFTPGPVSIPITFSVPAGASFYLLWADDNGSGSPDDGFSIDNLSLTPNSAGVPEPSAGLLSMLCLGSLALRRRRNR
ncbi:MAG: PEP-CTERM sorting domain-containing protein [Verrucomicrobiota bacterium]